jgi:hypothetical protein
MTVRSTGYPIVSQETLTAYMARYLATPEGVDVAKQFVAAGVQSYFMAHPIQGTIADAVAAYLVANPPANGQNATAAQVQQAVDAYFTVYPQDTVTDAELAAAVAAYLRANPPQQGAPGPAGQNATAAQVAEAVNAYMAANPLSGAVASAVAAYMAANPPPVPATVAPLADNATAVLGTGLRYAREDHRHPLPSGRLELVGTKTVSETMVLSVSLGVRRITTTLTGVTTSDRLVGVVTGAPSAGVGFFDVFPASAGNISVDALVPALGIGATWSIPLAVYRVV